MVDVLVKERRLTVVESVPGAHSGPELLAALAGLCAAYLALSACAAYPTPWGAVVAAAAVAVAETAWARPGLFLTWGLRRAALDDVARGLVRGAALVLLAARTLP